MTKLVSSLLVAFALCVATPASAQTFDNYKSTLSQTGGSTQNISTSGTNLDICAFMTFGHGSDDNPAMTVDGAAATHVLNVSAGNLYYLFCYAGATAGTNAVVFDSVWFPGLTYSGIIFSYKSVNQSGQPEATNTGTLSTTTTAVSVTTVTANAVDVTVFAVCGACTASASTGGSLKVPSTGLGGFAVADSGAVASPGSHSITIGDGTFGAGYVAMSFAPAGGVTPTCTASFTLLGAGCR